MSRSRRRVRIAVGLACLVVAAGTVVAITTLAVPAKPSFKFSAADAENLTWRLRTSLFPQDSRTPPLNYSACHVLRHHSALQWVPGQYYDSTASSYYELPLVERFNGSRWTIETVRSPDATPQVGPFPEDQLTDVSCPTDRFCIAVGRLGRSSTSTGLGAGVSGGLVEIFDGRTWRTVQLRASSRSDTNAYLGAVFCLQSRNCFIVGTAESPQVLQTLISYKYENGSWISVPFGGISKRLSRQSEPYLLFRHESLPRCGNFPFGTFGSSKALAATFAGNSWKLDNPLTAQQQAAGVSDGLADAFMPFRRSLLDHGIR